MGGISFARLRVQSEFRFPISGCPRCNGLVVSGIVLAKAPALFRPCNFHEGFLLSFCPFHFEPSNACGTATHFSQNSLFQVSWI